MTIGVRVRMIKDFTDENEGDPLPSFRKGEEGYMIQPLIAGFTSVIMDGFDYSNHVWKCHTVHEDEFEVIE